MSVDAYTGMCGKRTGRAPQFVVAVVYVASVRVRGDRGRARELIGGTSDRSGCKVVEPKTRHQNTHGVEPSTHVITVPRRDASIDESTRACTHVVT